eukprot:3825549-Rhodomonas_salina.1
MSPWKLVIQGASQLHHITRPDQKKSQSILRMVVETDENLGVLPDCEQIAEKLYHYCRGGLFADAIALLKSLDGMGTDDKEEIINWTDSGGNTHLHGAVQAVPVHKDD